MPRNTSNCRAPTDQCAVTDPDDRRTQRMLAMVEILGRQPPTMPEADLRPLISRHFPA